MHAYMHEWMNFSAYDYLHGIYNFSSSISSLVTFYWINTVQITPISLNNHLFGQI